MENLNLAELLRDCPTGMELDSTVFDNITFDYVNTQQNRVYCKVGKSESVWFTPKGGVNLLPDAKCVIFPKGKTTWDGFHRPFKDGDIVTWEDRGSLVAFIYKERKDVAVVKHHFALYTGSLGTVTDGEISLVENEIVFATEEEKQKLFDAIKANGYKWNAETKTLEKLVEPRFKVGDRIKYKNGKNKDGVKEGIILSITDDTYDVAVTNDMGIFIPVTDQDNWELALNKFDIGALKPFDKVLVRDFDNGIWDIEFFSRLFDGKHFKCLDLSYVQCIPYEGNEHLLGTTNDCDPFFKTWENNN